MAQHARLSNGAPLDIPDGMSKDQIRALVDQHEAMIKSGQNQTPDPRDEALKTILRPFVNQYKLASGLKPVAESAGRIGAAGSDLNPLIGIPDFIAGGYNAIHPLIPRTKNWYDSPIISDLIRQGIGAPELDPNAPAAQRYGEGMVTGALSGANKIKAAIEAGKMGLSTLTGDIGSSIATRFGGENWQRLGRWLGSIPGAMPDKIFGEPTRKLLEKTAGPQAKEVAAAGDVLNTQPTYGSLAGPLGRRMEKAFAAIPGVGTPIQNAMQRMQDAIQQGRQTAAETVNQGPLQPNYNAATIGKHIIDAARQMSAQLEAEGKQRFVDLENDPRAGPDTLVNAQPVLDHIRRLEQMPGATAGEIQALEARGNYLESMMHGNQYYRGMTIPNAPPGTMTLGALGKFRTELGAAIQGMPDLETTTAGKVRDTITDVLRYEYGRRGMGPDFEQANDFYKTHLSETGTVAKLNAIGGTPVYGKPGQYKGGLQQSGEASAATHFDNSMQSPSNIEPLVQSPNADMRAATAEFINGLGQTGQGADFRADTYSKQVGGIDPKVLAMLARDPKTGVPNQTFLDQLHASGVLGAESSVAPSRSGLTNAAMSGATALATIKGVGDIYSGVGVTPWLIPALTAITGAVGTHALESKAVTDAMSGRGTTTPLVDALYTAIPTATAATQEDNPERISAKAAATPRPPSPLDQLNRPNQFMPTGDQPAPVPAPSPTNQFMPKANPLP